MEFLEKEKTLCYSSSAGLRCLHLPLVGLSYGQGHWRINNTKFLRDSLSIVEEE